MYPHGKALITTSLFSPLLALKLTPLTPLARRPQSCRVRWFRRVMFSVCPFPTQNNNKIKEKRKNNPSPNGSSDLLLEGAKLNYVICVNLLEKAIKISFWWKAVCEWVKTFYFTAGKTFKTWFHLNSHKAITNHHPAFWHKGYINLAITPPSRNSKRQRALSKAMKRKVYEKTSNRLLRIECGSCQQPSFFSCNTDVLERIH